MGSALLYRLFGWGKVPRKYRTVLEKETIVLLDEGVGGAVILRKFRAPGRYHSYKAMAMLGSVVLTKKTLAVFTLWRPLVYLPLDHERFSELHLEVGKPGRLRIQFDAHAFNEEWSGTVECRLKTDKGAELLQWLMDRQGAR